METDEHQALSATADLNPHGQLDEAVVYAVVERIRTLRSRIEIWRSLNAAQGSEMQAAGLICLENSFDHSDCDRHQRSAPVHRREARDRH